MVQLSQYFRNCSLSWFVEKIFCRGLLVYTNQNQRLSVELIIHDMRIGYKIIESFQFRIDNEAFFCLSNWIELSWLIILVKKKTFYTYIWWRRRQSCSRTTGNLTQLCLIELICSKVFHNIVLLFLDQIYKKLSTKMNSPGSSIQYERQQNLMF